MTIRAVLFDLDETLLDRHSSLIVYVHRQLLRHSTLLSHVDQARYLARLIELDARGYAPKDMVFQRIADEFDLPEGGSELLLNDFLTCFPDTCVPFPRMHQTLTGLATRGLALGLITNGTIEFQQRKIDGLGIRRYFRAILVSEAEGVQKPDPEIFRRALHAVAVAPPEAVFVGDHPELDIHAAKAIGMRTVWMRNAFWPEPKNADASIAQLHELQNALQTINEELARQDQCG